MNANPQQEKHATMRGENPVDAVIATANHQPLLADQIMLVEVLEKTLGIVTRLQAVMDLPAHAQASGNIRTALRCERDLMNEMMKRNVTLGRAFTLPSPEELDKP